MFTPYKSNTWWCGVAIIILMLESEKMNVIYMVNFLILLISITCVSIALYYLRKERSILIRMANYDSLTNLYRREIFMGLVSNELEREERLSEEGCLLFADIDNFKSINDRFGHDEGDLVLKTIGDAIRSCLRSYDLSCRYGGEEFVLYLPEVNHEGALKFCKRLKEKTFDVTKDFKAGAITYSIGISHLPTDGVSFNELVKKADEAMYEAKKTKNTEVIFKESSIEQQKLPL